jgi:hypothetical protein
MDTTSESAQTVPEKETEPQKVDLIFRRFWKRSSGAVPPEKIPAYRAHRREQWPEKSGYSITQTKKRNDYHQERDSTHRHEAVRPGEHERVPISDVRRGGPSDARSEETGEYTKKVYNREKGEYEYVKPTRWAPGQYVCIPKFSVANTSTSPAEKAVLAALWAFKSVYDWHANYKPVVKGIHQNKIGDHAGISGSYASRVTDALERKGFLTKKGGGNGDRCTYYLAARELASWTYRALDPDSLRSRVQKLLQKAAEAIDWSKIFSAEIWHQRRRTKPQKDAAQRKLEQDQKRATARAQSDTGSTSVGEAVASKLTEWATFKEYMNASEEERHRYWKENRNGPAPPEE